MAHRTGEKSGWIGGWLGGFIWVVILSVIFFVQSKLIEGAIGLALFCTAVLFVFTSAPWKHPDTPYWKLMIPVYVALAGAIVWIIWSSDGPESLGLNRWNLFLVLPLLIPFATVGRRCWNDHRS
jgi:hypothetical protein